MFRSKFTGSSSQGVKYEEIDIENKKLLSDYSWFVCDKNHRFEIDLHEHEEMEIGYITKGKFALQIDSSNYKLQEGDVFIVIPRESHALQNISTDAEFYNFIFDLNFLESKYVDAGEINYIIPLVTGKLNVTKVIRNDRDTNMLVERMIEERKNERDGYELIIKGLLYLFLGHAFREYKTEMHKEVQGRQNYKLYDSIIQYIETNFDSEVTLENVAEHFKVSKSSVCQLFKKVNGKTFTEYLNYYRIQESLYYLADGKSTITEIAGSVGFSDLNYFSRVFRKYMHVSPNEYRKRLNLKM